MDNGRSDFFAAGLRHYGAALRAVGEFRESVFRELEDAMRRRQQAPVSSASSNTSTRSWSSRVDSPYLGVTAKADDVEPGASLELGLWWSPPFPCPHGLAVYAGVHGVPWAKSVTPPERFAGGVHKGGTAYLTLPWVPDGDVAALLDELLGALDVECRSRRRPISGSP